jgi:hypothetical protein
MTATTTVTATGARWLLGALALGLASSGLAADRQTDAEQCVSLIRIDRTEVVDDRNVLFYMKNGDIYRNRLPNDCPGLEAQDAFMYRTSLSQLCNVDIITVLTNMGFGFRPGASCGLGMFHPVKPLTAEELLQGEGLEDEDR